MGIRAGQTLLHYRLVEKVGAGGMGEVYRATDTHLGRDVAIKLLPEELRRDSQRLARLEREARLLASLNHPHVATLHSLEESEDGTRFLVMELVEGQTLAARLERGALPLSDVYTWGAQIAEALAAAHERGIVHRDLKPGNVMLTPSGVKLLDFGLAKAAEPSFGGAGSEMRTLVAESGPLTGEGTLVGTLRYMSPEQLEGRETDSRTDIWALGAVLHEMATGRPAFEGRSTASLIAAILASEPARVSSRCAVAPPALDHLVATCLAKDPSRRRQSAKDVALDLQWLAAEGGKGPPRTANGATATIRRRERLLWAAAVAVMAVVAALVWAIALRTVPGGTADRRVRFEVVVPALEWNATDVGIALSPQGDAIAYMSPSASGRPAMLWLREIDELDSRLIPGTEYAGNLFWSPDGRRIGYLKDGVIRVIDREGGPARTIARVEEFVFGPPTWATDDTIVFSGGSAAATPLRRLMRVSANGGDPVELSLPMREVEFAHIYPSMLPDGKRFLYLTMFVDRPMELELYLASLEGGEALPIEGVHSRAEYASGHLFYWDQGALVARRFDPDRARFAGDPVPLGEMTGAYFARTGMAQFTVSRGGRAVAYGRTLRSMELRWLDRSGRLLGKLGEPTVHRRFRISPTGEWVTVDIEDRSLGTGDIWVFDVQRGVPTRLVGGPGDDSVPTWCRNGQDIAYSSDATGPPRIFTRKADGTGEPTPVQTEENSPSYVTDCSPSGEYIIYTGEKTQEVDLYVVPVEGDEPSRLYAGGPGDQIDARFSPDSRWIAFASSELGSVEVFVAPLADSAARRRVSGAGGRSPVWSPEGGELYFVGDDTVYAASFSSQTGAIGVPKELFSLAEPLEILNIDVAPDGDRFLVSVEDRSRSKTAITVLLGWPAMVE